MKGMLYAFILSGLLECVVVTIVAVKTKFKFIIQKIDYRNEVKKLIVLTIPLLLGNAMYEVNQIVDNQIATGLGSGSASVLNYGASIHDMVVGVIVTSVSVVLFSHCSTWVAKGELKNVEKSLEKILTYLTLILLPIMVMCVVSGDQIVELFYGRGSFGQTEIKLTYSVVIGYYLGFIFQAARANLVKIFYAFQDSKTPMINGMISIVCNVVLSFLLSRHIGISGVSLATIISMFIATVLLIRDVKKYLPNFSEMACMTEIVKGIIATVISVVVLILIKQMTFGNVVIALIVEGGMVVIIYCVSLCIFKSNSIRDALDIIKRK